MPLQRTDSQAKIDFEQEVTRDNGKARDTSLFGFFRVPLPFFGHSETHLNLCAFASLREFILRLLPYPLCNDCRNGIRGSFYLRNLDWVSSNLTRLAEGSDDGLRA
jgi:hypothetical protein